MSNQLKVLRAGPSMTVQDQGRAGYLAFGLSRSGAVDLLALHEGAALLGQSPTLAAIEMGGMGGTFTVTQDTRIALTGAPMKASIDGSTVLWNASYLLPQGAKLVIGAAHAGTYGYLHVGGGIAAAPVLGARSTHLAAGIGATLKEGDALDIAADPLELVGQAIDPDPRFDGGLLRILPSLQTASFAPSEIARFENTAFQRDTRGNRMGVRIVPDGAGFETQAGLSVLSEVIVSGDVQVTGDGTPFVLLAECQTTGGYPRIGSVLPMDLPRAAQARAGATLRFQFITLPEAVALERKEAARRKALRGTLRALIRDPHDIADLLSYQLISGMTAGDDLERAEP
ncbi:MAG: biotin-dependent carboxyltransferase family protein [Yoonia sp.]|nr:biotin-dependent carboxyltransferase family protein [Yoonia sp.]